MPASTALLKAVSAGRPRQVRLLLDSGTEIESKDDCGQTPLIRVVFVENQRSRERILKLLLNRGAKVSTCDVVGRDALSWACLYGRAQDVTQMLEYADVDLDLNHGDVNGHTALFHAVTSGSAATVKLMVSALQKYGMNVDVPAFNGVTPVVQAIKLGHDVCASILITHGKANASGYYQEEWKNEVSDKWASKTKSKPFHCEFPPIVPKACSNKIRYRENCARNLRVYTDFDSEEETCSSYGSDITGFIDDSLTSVSMASSDLDTVSSLEAVSGSASLTIEDLDDTSIEDELEKLSRRQKSGKPFIPSRDLHRLFNMYSEQHTGSYRPAAMQTATNCNRSASHLGSSENVQKARKGQVTFSDVVYTMERKKPQDLRKDVMLRIVKGITEQDSWGVVPTVWPGLPKSGSNRTEDKATILPTISEKLQPLVQTTYDDVKNARIKSRHITNYSQN